KFWQTQSKVYDWAAGDFETQVSDRHGYRFERWQAFGVMFDRAGIEAMLAPAANGVAPAPQAIERNKGGRPPIYDWETARAAVTLECASRVTATTGQAEIEEAFMQWFARRG